MIQVTQAEFRVDADHMHYYFESRGKYYRKLVNETQWAMVLMMGGRIAKNTTHTQDGVYKSHMPKVGGGWEAKLMRANVRFPYMLMEMIPKGMKIRARKGNQCPNCPVRVNVDD
jgi:hypothetical protein